MTIQTARPLLRRISAGGSINPYAIAFILTERTFRGPVVRVMELLYSAVLIFIGRSEPRITIGHSQVSFQFWRFCFARRNSALLFGALSLEASYRVCCLYLEAHQPQSLRQMLICYNGKPSQLYASRFIENLNIVLTLAASMRIETARMLPSK